MDVSLTLASFAATYWLHSTILIAGVWFLIRFGRLTNRKLRDGLWKFALLGGIATSLLQTTISLPQFGPSLSLSERVVLVKASPSTAPLTTRGNGTTSKTAEPVETTTEQRATSVTEPVTATPWSVWTILTIVWAGGALLGLFRLAASLKRLHALKRSSRSVHHPIVVDLVSRLVALLDLRGEVEVRAGSQVGSPMVAGWIRWSIFIPPAFVKQLTKQQLAALLAHELAHLVRRDPWWVLGSRIVSAVFFFQPLNLVVRRGLRIEAEFLADQLASEALDDRVGLARCLISLNEWLASSDDGRIGLEAAAIGMATYRSTLGQRVENLLVAGDRLGRLPRWIGIGTATAAFVALGALSIGAPRIVPETILEEPAPTVLPPVEKEKPKPPTIESRTPEKPTKPEGTKRTIVPSKTSKTSPSKKWPSKTRNPSKSEKDSGKNSSKKKHATKKHETQEKTPASTGLRGFRGRIVGRVSSSQPELGLLVVRLEKIRWLGKKNQAKSPRDSIGHTFVVDGYSVDWLDGLLGVKSGDRVELDVEHRQGESLRFTGKKLHRLKPSKKH
ncbi:MAG: M56 family metallopeptidase [Planctomycetota bacterium]